MRDSSRIRTTQRERDKSRIRNMRKVEGKSRIRNMPREREKFQDQEHTSEEIIQESGTHKE